MRKALFPGSFDPFTLGHESIVRRALPIFDHIVIGIGSNSTKSNLFSLEQRVQWIKTVFADEPRVEIAHYTGLTVDFAKVSGCHYILRGLRNSMDYQFESSIAQMNEALNPSITTVFINCEAQYAAINATIVREIFKNGGDISRFVPSGINPLV